MTVICQCRESCNRNGSCPCSKPHRYDEELCYHYCPEADYRIQTKPETCHPIDVIAVKKEQPL